MARTAWHDIESLSGIGAGGSGGARRDPRLPSNIRTGDPFRGLEKFTRLLATLALWIERGRQRRTLAQLDARMLRDIGITRLDAQRECEKPFWR